MDVEQKFWNTIVIIPVILGFRPYTNDVSHTLGVKAFASKSSLLYVGR